MWPAAGEDHKSAMELTIYNRTNQDMSFVLPKYEAIMASAERKMKLKKGYTVSVTFVRSRTIHTINRDYRGIDRPTDVITFAAQDELSGLEVKEEALDLGDIFINIEYAKKQAVQYGHTYERELCFLFTHGLLHCLGYDHMKPEEETAMFRLQDQILDPIIGRNK